MEFFKWEKHFNSLAVIPAVALPWVVTSVLDFLTKRSPSFDQRTILSRCEVESGETLSEMQVSLACEGLKFLMQWVLTRNPQNTGKYNVESILVSYATLPEDTIAAVVQAYSRYQNTSRVALEKGMLLKDSQWTLGVTVQSDLQPEVLEPYVRGSFTLVDATSGESSRRVVEFTLPQFQEFLREMKRASSVLSSY